MPVPAFSGLPPYPTFEDHTEKINKLVNELRNLLLNLDSLNVRSLTADNIDSGTINAGKVTVRGESGNVFYQIDDHGIVANNGSVNTLEFNLATGLLKLVQVLIQTASGYPRVEINPTGNLLAAYLTPTVSTSLRPSFAGAPALYFDDGITVAAIYPFSVLGSSIVISSSGSIDLRPAGNIEVPSWSKLYSNGDHQTLQNALGSKATSGISTSLSGSHNHGISPGRYIMTYNSDGSEAGLQQWTAAPTHSHAQN